MPSLPPARYARKTAPARTAIAIRAERTGARSDVRARIGNGSIIVNRRMIERRLRIAIVAAAILVAARSAVFLIWEQAGFDSDQAIFGLMARHIVEGRAFPVFIYGDR